MTTSSRRPGSSIRPTWARPTTAGSRRSAMTPRHRATRRSRRSRRGSPGTRWPQANSASDPVPGAPRSVSDQPSAPDGSTPTLSHRSPGRPAHGERRGERRRLRRLQDAGGVVGLLGHGASRTRDRGSARSARRTAPAATRSRRRSGSARSRSSPSRSHPEGEPASRRAGRRDRRRRGSSRRPGAAPGSRARGSRPASARWPGRLGRRSRGSSRRRPARR